MSYRSAGSWVALVLVAFVVGVGLWCAVHAHDAQAAQLHGSAGAPICVFHGPAAALPDVEITLAPPVASPLVVLATPVPVPLPDLSLFEPPEPRA